MAPRAWVVSDELWELVEPLPGRERRFRYPGRRRLPDRQCLQGILYVLHTGIPWHDLPPELGLGSGVTCWRRLEEWQRAGVWERLHRLLLTKLRAADAIDFSRAIVDSSQVQAKMGLHDGPEPGRPRPARLQAPPRRRHGRPARGQPDRRQPQRHHPADPAGGRGPADRRRPGGPRRRPRVLVADRGYDHDAYRRQLGRRGIRPQIARRQTAHGSGLGRVRWPVERSLSWLHQFRRLLVRFERRADMHEAFLVLGCCLICLRKLQGSF